MKQEDRELLLKDLSARLPYDVRCRIVNTEIGDVIPAGHLNGRDIDKFRIFGYIEIYPYLRPMSSMTDEELNEFHDTFEPIGGITGLMNSGLKVKSTKSFDFLNKNHFDYRGLIPKNLAIEAKKGMYKFE